MNDKQVVEMEETEKVGFFKKIGNGWKKHKGTVRKTATVIGVGAGMALAYGLGRQSLETEFDGLDTEDDELENLIDLEATEYNTDIDDETDNETE